MGFEAISARALRSRWCRSLATLGALLLAVEAMGLPVLTAYATASCCCAHGSTDAKCRCKVCTHARAVESGRPFIGGCAPASDPVRLVNAQPAFPVFEEAAPAPTRAPVVVSRPVPPPPDLVAEVPTPPPLA